MKNHIVGQKISFENGTTTFLSLAKTNINIAVMKSDKVSPVTTGGNLN